MLLRSGDQSSEETCDELSYPRSCAQFFKEYALTAELNLVTKQNLPGIYVIPKARNPFEWLGVLFVRQGLYQGAIPRFTLRLPANFFTSFETPKFMFEQGIFHPQISAENGELQLAPTFSNWRRNYHHIYHVLLYAQRIFHRIEIQNALNEKAAKLYQTDPEQFRLKCSESVRRTRETVYDPPLSSDPNSIRFTPWDSTVHEPIRSQILGRPAREMTNQQDASIISLSSQMTVASVNNVVPQNAQTSGLSWFDADRFEVLKNEHSRPTTAPP